MFYELCLHNVFAILHNTKLQNNLSYLINYIKIVVVNYGQAKVHNLFDY